MNQITEHQLTKQLSTFKQEVVLPSLKSLQQKLETQGFRTNLVETSATEDLILSELLQGLVQKFSAVFLADAEALYRLNTRLVLAAFVIQLPEGLLPTKHLYEDRCCVGIECQIKEHALLALVSGFYADRKGQFKTFHRGFKVSSQGSDLTTLTRSDLLHQITNIFEAFYLRAVSAPAEVQPVQPVKDNIGPPQPTEIQPSPDPRPLPHPTVEPIPAPTSIKTDPKLTAVREQIGALGLGQAFEIKDFRALERDRLFDWACEVEQKREFILQRSDYEKLYRQAAGFVMSLKPTSALEFIDYFDLYCAVVRQEDLLNRFSQIEGDVPLLARINAAGKPNDPEQVNEEMARELRLLFRKLSANFSKQNASGQTELLGTCTIATNRMSFDSIIDSIQGHNEALEVKFERLSWAALQVYLNIGFLPSQERKLGRTVVHSYWQSARLTIRKPTEPVQCIQNDANYLKFEFVREIQSTPPQLAKAQVTVLRDYGLVALHSYQFEPNKS